MRLTIRLYLTDEQIDVVKREFAWRKANGETLCTTWRELAHAWAATGFDDKVIYWRERQAKRQSAEALA